MKNAIQRQLRVASGLIWAELIGMAEFKGKEKYW